MKLIKQQAATTAAVDGNPVPECSCVGDRVLLNDPFPPAPPPSFASHDSSPCALLLVLLLLLLLPPQNLEVYKLPEQMQGQVTAQYERDVARVHGGPVVSADAEYKKFLSTLGGAPPPELMGLDGHGESWFTSPCLGVI
jgi:hypothetical protein